MRALNQPSQPTLVGWLVRFLSLLARRGCTLRYLRAIWPLVIAPALVPFGVSGEETQPTNSAVRITVIKNCLQPLGTWEIVGTDVKGVSKLKDLTKVLHTHRKQNPEARYEVLAEVKATPEGEKAIVDAITKAGITLEHYWAARSALPPPGTPVGPHGIGFVDRGLAAEPQASPTLVRLVATVQKVAILSSFSGEVIRVDADPRYALTLRIESSRGATNFAPGQVVTFGIHSPSKLFSGEPTKGKTYGMELDRKSEHGKVTFSRLRLRAADTTWLPTPGSNAIPNTTVSRALGVGKVVSRRGHAAPTELKRIILVGMVTINMALLRSWCEGHG